LGYKAETEGTFLLLLASIAAGEVAAQRADQEADATGAGYGTAPYWDALEAARRYHRERTDEALEAWREVVQSNLQALRPIDWLPWSGGHVDGWAEPIQAAANLTDPTTVRQAICREVTAWALPSLSDRK
jgi:hypothetical protein